MGIPISYISIVDVHNRPLGVEFHYILRDLDYVDVVNEFFDNAYNVISTYADGSKLHEQRKEM